MKTNDAHFPFHDDDRRVDSSAIGSTEPVPAGFSMQPDPTSLPPAIELPPRFCLRFQVTCSADSDPVSAALAPEPFGRLVFAILNEAIGLAISAPGECQLSYRWVEKQDWIASGQLWTIDEPEKWNLSGSFRGKVALLEKGKLPRTVIAAVQSIFAEGFAGMDGLAHERRSMANSLMPATTVPTLDFPRTVRAASPIRDGDKEGFHAIIDLGETRTAVPVFFSFPFAALQRLAASICEILVLDGNKITLAEFAEELCYLASGNLLADFQFILLGLIVFAASECSACLPQRREFFREHKTFCDALDCARYLV